MFVAIGWKNNFLTLLIGHVVLTIAFVYLSVKPKLQQMDPNMYEAALDLGCTPNKALHKVVLPEILPGIFSGMILAFTLSLDDVVISYFAAGPGSNTLPLYIYSLIKTGITPDVNALISLILLVVFLILTISAFISVRKLRQEALS